MPGHQLGFNSEGGGKKNSETTKSAINWNTNVSKVIFVIKG